MHKRYMQMAIDLAQKGKGKTFPNPLVGAVIVKNGKIIGKGYHRKIGQSHAEINALKSAGLTAKGATLYVSLEPCSHFGRTPPCVDSIIKTGIKKVICAILDPNPNENGAGLRKLKRAGIEARVGILENEARELNKVYFKYISSGFPWVILKIAQTLDGKIATSSGDSKWITEKDAREFSHFLRSQADAVVVGINTVLRDNPQLTARKVKGKNPLRIVLDSKGKIPLSSNLIRENKDGKTIVVVTSKKAQKRLKAEVEIWKVKADSRGMVDLKKFLKLCVEKRVGSILLEGGSKVYTSFLKNRLVDEIDCFISPKIVGQGISAFGDLSIKKISSALKLKDVKLKIFSRDILLGGYPDWRK